MAYVPSVERWIRSAHESSRPYLTARDGETYAVFKSLEVRLAPVMPDTTGPALLGFTRRIGGENSARCLGGDVDRMAESHANPLAGNPAT